MRGPLSLPVIDLEAYGIRGLDRVLTPALAIYADIVEANLQATLRLLGAVRVTARGRETPLLATAASK